MGGTVTRDVAWSVKLPADYQRRLASVEGATLIVPLLSGENAVKTLTFFNNRFPHIPVRAGSKDPDSYDTYAHFASVFQIAFGSAVVIAATALAFLAFELAWANAPQVSALAASGIRRRHLRVAAGVQAAWPVLSALPGVCFGVLAGFAIRSYFGTTNLLEPSVIGAVIGPWLVALILTGAAGASAAVTDFQRGSISDS